MADHRLDDAIDAVVRAVDRIERATRGQKLAAELGDAIQSEADLALDLQPPASNVAPGRDAWEPDPEAPIAGVRKKDKGKKKKHRSEPAADAPAPPSRAAQVPFAGVPAGAGDAPEDEPAESVAAEPAAEPSLPAAPPSAPAEVHELVGRIVARTQELDDHLEASRALRSEITELVARLAAAATQQR